MSASEWPRGKAALAYARMFGWRVFPINWRTEDGFCSCGLPECGQATAKHPLVQYGVHAGTNDLQQIERWWKKWPLAGIGLTCGTDSGVWALDVDPYNGGDDTLREAEKEFGELPDTVTNLTGGGGQHYLWKHPGEGLRIRNAISLGAGLDVKGDGGYIILPPSSHANGNEYCWEIEHRPEETSFAEAPDWLLQRVIARIGTDHDGDLPDLPGDEVEATPEALRRLEEACTWLKEAVDGGRHAARKAAGMRAGRLVAGGILSTSEALARLQEAAESNSVVRPEKIRKTLIDCMRIGAQSPWGPPKRQDIPPPPTDADAPAELNGPLRVIDGGKGKASGDVDDAGSIPAGEPEDYDDRLPEIWITGVQLRKILKDSWAALHLANKGPRVFRRADYLLRIVKDSEGLKLKDMGEAEVYGELMRCADWWRRNKDGDDIAARPVKDVARDMSINPSDELPELEEIAGSPLFNHEGTLITTPGYHADSKLWLHMRGNFTIPPVPVRPSSQHVDDAKTMILDDLMVDFPFSSASDQTHAVAALLLPFVRRMVQGPTPIHVIEAPIAGTGKTLLASILHMISQGREAEPTTLPRDPTELDKKITSMLMRAQPVILFDNVDINVKMGELAAAITATRWQARELGFSRMVDLPNRATWFMTANNPNFSIDLVRRCLRIRMEPDRDRPWERSSFKHDPIGPWVEKNRADLVWSCLVLIRRWIADGKPSSTKSLGSFESWANVIGGILQHNGFAMFLDSQEEMYEQADNESAEWRAFTMAWWNEHKSMPVTAKQLVYLSTSNDLMSAVIGDKSERSQILRIAKAVAKKKGRIFDGYKIIAERDAHTKKLNYSLEPVESQI